MCDNKIVGEFLIKIQKQKEKNAVALKEASHSLRGQIHKVTTNTASRGYRSHELYHVMYIIASINCLRVNGA